MSNTSSETADIITPAKSRKWMPILLVLSLPAVVFLKMGFFFLLIGMFPTFLAMAFARDSRGNSFSIVAAFNFAGLFPDLVSITLGGGTPRVVLDRLADPQSWAAMYGAALIGWGVVWLSPTIAMIILESIYRGRLRHMEALQKKLEEEWGQRITGQESDA